MIDSMSKISDFASNSIMGVVRKIVNHIVDNVDPQISDATDHLPARFSGTFNDSTRNLTMTIESQGASAENLVATVNIPAGGGGSGGPTYSAGNGINITSENAIEIDTNVTATKQALDTLQSQVGDAFTEVAIGADGKSLDFTALDGQVNNIVLPISGSSEWTAVTLNNIASFNWKIGDILVIGSVNIENTVYMVNLMGVVTSIDDSNKISLVARSTYHTPNTYYPAWGASITFSTKNIFYNYLNKDFKLEIGNLIMDDIREAYTNASLN